MKPILIIEDNEKNLKLARDLLRWKRYETLEAMTGAEGLRLARENTPSLVLMDIQLPDMDGVSALRELRADPLTRGLHVLAVSASVMPDDQQRILASGFDAYITKPIDVKEFLAVIEKFLNSGTR